MDKFLLSIILFTPFVTCAQISFQEDSDDLFEREKKYCKPGVNHSGPSKGLRLVYQWLPQTRAVSEAQFGDVDPENTILFKYKIPIVNRCDLKILLGHQFFYRGANFRLNDAQGSSREILPGLKSNRFNAYVLRSIDSTLYAGFTASAAFNGNYSPFVDFSSRFAIYRAVAMLGVKKNENTEWGLGALAKSGFRNRYILPFAFFNHSFNAKWGIETIILANVKGRYSSSPKTVLYFGFEYRSRDYNIDLKKIGGPSEVIVRRSRINALVEYSRKLHPWIWLEANCGYRIPFDLEVANIENRILEEQNNGLFIELGVFISPPDHLIK